MCGQKTAQILDRLLCEAGQWARRLEIQTVSRDATVSTLDKVMHYCSDGRRKFKDERENMKQIAT